MPTKLVILKRKKHTLQHLKLGILKFGIHKIGCSMSWMRYMCCINFQNYTIQAYSMICFTIFRLPEGWIFNIHDCTKSILCNSYYRHNHFRNGRTLFTVKFIYSVNTTRSWKDLLILLDYNLSLYFYILFSFCFRIQQQIALEHSWKNCP